MGTGGSAIKPYIESTRRLRESIERNRDDSDFAERGNEIVYIFDANVFIFYIDLFDDYQIARDFYPLVGRDHSDPLVKVIERLTADFLFSGKLPGQIQPGFISVPHLQEVMAQTKRVALKLKGITRSHARGLTEARRLELQAILEMDQPLTERLASLGRELPEAWLNNLNARAHFSTVLRTSFLDDGGALVPLDREAWGEEAARCTLAEVRSWEDLLPEPPLRLAESLRDDAVTLQIMVKLCRASKSQPDRKFVFVTADEALEKAVSARFEELGVPNFVRSPRDYLPLINFNAMAEALRGGWIDTSMETRFRDLFEKLNGALDGISTSLVATAWRDHSGAKQLQQINETWIELSQSATVINARHLSQSKGDIFEQVAEFVDSAGGNVTTLIDRSLDELRRRHIALMLKGALADRARARHGDGSHREGRIRLQLIDTSFGSLTARSPINEFLEHAIASGSLPDSTWEGINQRPDSYEVLLFACAVFAAAQRWSAGIDFGWRAWKAAEGDTPPKRSEAAYLLALCLRFSMRDSRQLKSAMELLELNLASYARQHQTGHAALLRRLRDRMELGNLLLTASVSHALAKMPLARKTVGAGFNLLQDDSVSTQFTAGVRHLVEARIELLDSEGLNTGAPRDSDELDSIFRWLKLMSATNILGAFIFERTVPGLAYAQYAVSDCREELVELGAQVEIKARNGEVARPTQSIYYHAARAIATDNPDARLEALDGLEKELVEIFGDLRNFPACDQLEFRHLRDWLDLQRKLDAPDLAP